MAKGVIVPHPCWDGQRRRGASVPRALQCCVDAQCTESRRASAKDMEGIHIGKKVPAHPRHYGHSIRSLTLVCTWRTEKGRTKEQRHEKNRQKERRKRAKERKVCKPFSALPSTVQLAEL